MVNIITSANGEQDIKETNDLSETIKELNEDKLDLETGMSGIDMRSRLSHFEIPAILQVDTLVALNVLPVECLPLTRQKKRLCVSLGGLGRREIVKIATGRTEDEKKDFVKSNSAMGLLMRKRNNE